MSTNLLPVQLNTRATVWVFNVIILNNCCSKLELRSCWLLNSARVLVWPGALCIGSTLHPKIGQRDAALIAAA